MKKLKRLIVILAVCGMVNTVYAAESTAPQDGLAVNLIVGNEHINYRDAANPFVVSIPIQITAGASPNGYVMVLKDKRGNGVNTVQPFSAYQNGEVSLVTHQTGAYEVFKNTKYFSDTAGHWAEQNINFAAAREIFNGDGAGKFNPDAPMTRAMFTQLIANLEKAELSAFKTTRFEDVPVNAWYMPAVEWAAGKGLASGTGINMFSPEANITQEQMAAMVMNYMNYKGIALPPRPVQAYNDEAGISAWAVEPVTFLHQAGVIEAKPGNVFNPQSVATRADVATIFTKLITTYIEAMR